MLPVLINCLINSIDIDADFDPGLDDIDDEQTLDEEEAFSSDYSNELNDLQNVSLTNEIISKN